MANDPLSSDIYSSVPDSVLDEYSKAQEKKMQTPTIPELQQKVERLRHELVSAEADLHEARVALTGIKPGDVVHYRGTEHRVTYVKPMYGDQKPWLHGNRKSKDGTYGRREVHMYTDWERR